MFYMPFSLKTIHDRAPNMPPRCLAFWFVYRGIFSWLHFNYCNLIKLFGQTVDPRFDQAADALRREICLNQQTESFQAIGRLAVALVLVQLAREDSVAAEKAFKEWGNCCDQNEVQTLEMLLQVWILFLCNISNMTLVFRSPGIRRRGPGHRKARTQQSVHHAHGRGICSFGAWSATAERNGVAS